MTTAAIYARFSDENQRQTSIDDQVAAAAALAARLGARVVGAPYADRAISGTRRDRHDFLRMLADAQARKFDVLALWDLKRLSRGEDLPQLLARLKFAGVRVVTCDGFDSDQEGSHFRGWVDGMIGNTYLIQLGKDVHRGLVGQVNRHLSAGGMPYGYRPVTRELGQDLEIDPAAAENVRWIYDRAAAGWSARRIARELNARGIPGPRSGTWVFSAIYGHPKKRTGILRNPIYRGRYVWNRSRFVKDPDTGKRHRFERPPEEWLTDERPHLRIVPEDLWQAVQDRLRHTVRPKGGRPPRTALSGILRCKHCGGAVVAVSQSQYGCAAHKDRGPSVCAGVRVNRRAMEQCVLDAARETLEDPAEIEALRRDVAELLRADAADGAALARSAHVRLGKVNRQIERLVQAVADAGWSRALADRLRLAEAERDELQAAIARAAAGDATQAKMIPRLIDKYMELLASLPAKLSQAPDEARETLRQCFGDIRLVNSGGKTYAEVPQIGEILTVVAGVGFEPTTFGL